MHQVQSYPVKTVKYLAAKWSFKFYFTEENQG